MPIDNIVDFEIVFMNCDSVMIDPNAVVSMSFEVESEKYEWDRKHQRIDNERKLKSFKMSLDLNRSQLFRRRYITGMFGEGVDSRAHRALENVAGGRRALHGTEPFHVAVRDGKRCREGGLRETAPVGLRVELVCHGGRHGYSVEAETYTPSSLLSKSSTMPYLRYFIM